MVEIGLSVDCVPMRVSSCKVVESEMFVNEQHNQSQYCRTEIVLAALNETSKNEDTKTVQSSFQLPDSAALSSTSRYVHRDGQPPTVMRITVRNVIVTYDLFETAVDCL